MERLGWRRSFLALAAAAAIATFPSCASSEVEPVPATGDLAKLDFTLKDMYGKDVNLASFAGQADHSQFLGDLVWPLQGGDPCAHRARRSLQGAAPDRAGCLGG
jgi:hypothetical protein